MIGDDERRRMLRVPLCGPRVISRLEAIGIQRLADLHGRDPFELVDRVNDAAGRIIWRPPMAIAAMANLIEAAERDEPARRVDARHA